MNVKTKRWEAYTGVTQEDAYNILKNILNKDGINYDTTTEPPIFMYDAKCEQKIIKVNGLQLSLIHVSADPITRLFLSVFGANKNLSTITLLSVKYNHDTKQCLKFILEKFSEEVNNVPWKIRENTRFQYAILLELINKLKWEKFILKKKGMKKWIKKIIGIN